MRKISNKNRLKELREDNDMSQSYLATLLDMSQTGYSKYETGENDIPTNILIKLSKIYKTSIDYLLFLLYAIFKYYYFYIDFPPVSKNWV